VHQEKREILPNGPKCAGRSILRPFEAWARKEVGSFFFNPSIRKDFLSIIKIRHLHSTIFFCRGEASRRGVAQAAASINEIRTFSQGQLARFLERAAINSKIKVPLLVTGLNEQSNFVSKQMIKSNSMCFVAFFMRCFWKKFSPHCPLRKSVTDF